ncbi:MAG TPA: hypothetical protein VHO48_08995 [Anaerolineaceae bacterium]|nr:hypothetical protein [Anaerolineaceae bacterium]
MDRARTRGFALGGSHLEDNGLRYYTRFCFFVGWVEGRNLAGKPVVEHVMETVSAGQDLDDPKTKSRIAEQVLPLIEDVANPVERDAYRQKLARLLRVDERALMEAQPGRPVRRAQRAAPPQEAQPAASGREARPIDPIETYALSVLLQHPEYLYLLDRALQEAGLARLDIPDFQHTDHQLILRLVQQAVEQADVEPGVFITDHVPEALAEKLLSLQQSPLPAEPDQERVIEDLSRAIMRSRYNSITRSLNQLRFLLEDVQEQGDLRGNAYAELVVQHLQTRDRIDRALSQVTNKRTLLSPSGWG